MAGRPAPVASPAASLGLDVGGTKISLVATDGQDRLLLSQTVPTDRTALGSQIRQLSLAAVRRLDDDGQSVEAVGVAVPGQVDPLGRTLGLAVNLGAPKLALAELLEEALGLPVIVEHDARAAAHWLCTQQRPAALAAGTRPPADHLAYVSVGTGISAGVVLAGRLLRGASGLAGEIGHTSAVVNGPLCACGLHGCLETVAAGPALARRLAEELRLGRASRLSATATAREIFAAAAAGDELAAELIDEAVAHLARAVRSLVLTFGLQQVVIGGGLAGAGQPLLERIEVQLDTERQASPLVEAAFAGCSVELLKPEALAGARGAAAIARASAAAREATLAQREGVGSS